MKTDIGFSVLKCVEVGIIYHYADISRNFCNMSVNNGRLWWYNLCIKRNARRSCISYEELSGTDGSPAVRRHVATGIYFNIFHVIYCKNI
jgi:hypothetical protein